MNDHQWCLASTLIDKGAWFIDNMFKDPAIRHVDAYAKLVNIVNVHMFILYCV